ncbi:MAG: DUF362 domain-containing protein [Deltaproteobacteria bacterium]|nr:MAG: DUF362 domain-containing protein [Deltaproteobacteria bacterium]
MDKGKGRREFFKDLAKYGGAGLAAVGLLSLHKPREAGAVADLDRQAHSELWKFRDAWMDQVDEFIANSPLPKGYFSKEPEEFVNNMKPVKWSHHHPNWYTGNGNKALVSITEATPLHKDIKGDIKRSIDKLGGLGKSLKKTDKILIKPNSNTGDEWPRGGTDYRFLDALIQILHDEGYGNVSVGDSCGPWGPTERVFPMLRFDEVCKKNGVELLDFDKTKWMHVTNANAEYLGKFGGGDGTVGYPEPLRNFDKIIYTPVMKTHVTAGFTMGLKLSVGILHREDRGNQLHNLNHIFNKQAVGEINIPIKPDLVIMDGRRSLIAGGPSHGEEIAPGFIVASGCQVANDVVGVEILQEWYPASPNMIGMYVWNNPLISQAVKVGCGYARGPEDIKRVL